MSTFLDEDEEEVSVDAIQNANSGMSADMLSAIAGMLKTPSTPTVVEDDEEEYYEEDTDDEDEEMEFYGEETTNTSNTNNNTISLLTQGMDNTPKPQESVVSKPVENIGVVPTSTVTVPSPAPSITVAPAITVPDNTVVSNNTTDNMNNTIGVQVLTVDERLKKYADEILASVLHEDDESLTKRAYLYGQLLPDIFRDENYIIYKILYKYKEQKITPDTEFMQMYLMRNESLIRNSKDYININTYADLDENVATGYTIGVLKQFTRLKGLKPLDKNQFNLTIEKYKIEFENKIMNEAYAEAKVILNEGMEKRGHVKQGFEDSVAHVKDRVAYIESMVDRTAGDGFMSMQELLEKDEDRQQFTKIGDFGELKHLNKYVGGGIYKPYFYSVIAPTKGGKSKFCTRLIHNIVVENGNNAVVWAHEGGSGAWMAQFRAVHFDYYYNRDKIDNTQMLRGINQEVIEKGTYPTPELASLENVSRLDLKTNPNYGHIEFISRPLNVETFIDEIETAVQKSNADIVLVDYLQMIDTLGRGKSKAEYVGRAYQKLLAYANHRNVAILSPAQYTQEFMKEALNAKEGSTFDVRTAGGESSEVIRTPDYNIALYASTEDLVKHRMKILSIPSRKCQPFPSIDIYHDLGVCRFIDMD